MSKSTSQGFSWKVKTDQEKFLQEAKFVGYNWEKYKTQMWPAMLFHRDIKSHVYKPAIENKWDKYRSDIAHVKMDHLDDGSLTHMFLLMTILDGKKKQQNVENFQINLRRYNASWPDKAWK